MASCIFESLLSRYYPEFPPTRRPGADQHRYATMVRDLIEQHRADADGPVRLLDFGCGRGAVELYDFRAEGVRVCGADVDPVVLSNPMLDEAKVIVDGRLDWPDGTFDVICSSHVLEHIPEPARTLAELYRVLRPGGHVIAVTPNARSLPALIARVTPSAFHRWVNAKRGRQAADTFPTLYRLNTARQVQEAVAPTGFAVERLEYWEGFAEGVATLLESPSHRAKLVEAGRQRALQFSWRF